MVLNKNSEQESVHSAVIVLHDLSTDSLILTKRGDQLRNHPGEICFPGGVKEAQDENFYLTALRELEEELGILANRITLFKELSIEQTMLGAIIHPWFGSIESISPYYLNLEEVTAIIPIPMSLVVNPQNYQELIVEKAGKKFKSCEFIPNEELVWGATARIMKQLTVEIK